jgi:RNA polymerase sigma-70 factor (ECF subfamily)
MKQSDEALMAAHLNGDTTAFEQLVRRHGESLLGYLTRMSGNRDRAEDFFQETFKRVHQKGHTFNVEGRFKPWLFAIATNVTMSGLRKTSRRPRVISLNVNNQCNGGDCPQQTVPIADTSNEPSQKAIKDEQKELVAKAVENLPAR